MLGRRVVALALTACLACWCFGCGDRQEASAPPSGEEASAPPSGEEASAPPSVVGAADTDTPRWVHRFVPKGLVKYRPEEDRWRPESEAPRARETTPGQVVWEVSGYPPGSQPTPEQQRAADDLVERCYAAALRHRWDQVERGLADGFRPMDGVHYRNEEFMLDDHVIDPDYPEVLMYYPTPPDGKSQLAGFMFYPRSTEARGPQFGGPLTIWHYHSWGQPMCLVAGFAVGLSREGQCRRGVLGTFSLEMMHVWLIDHPDGPFATTMYLPLSILEPQLENRRAERGF